MKKTRILAGALIAAVMLVGAGYAAWTDKLTINSTVSTGELNVKFTEPTWYLDTETGFDDYTKTTWKPICVISDKNVKALELTLNNLYPGIGAKLETRFENDGTIPAVIKSIVYDNTVTDKLKGSNNKDLRQMTPDEKAKITVKGTIKQYDEKGVAKNTLALDTNLRDLGSKLTNLNWKLEPKDYVYFDHITFTLPKDAVNGDEMENTYVKCSLELNFGQHNVK